MVGALRPWLATPVPDATVTATDTVDDQAPTEPTTTDTEGGFTVTVPDIGPGSHKVDISYASNHILEPATRQVSVVITHDTILTVDSPSPHLHGARTSSSRARSRPPRVTPCPTPGSPRSTASRPPS